MLLFFLFFSSLIKNLSFESSKTSKQKINDFLANIWKIDNKEINDKRDNRKFKNRKINDKKTNDKKDNRKLKNKKINNEKTNDKRNNQEIKIKKINDKKTKNKENFQEIENRENFRNAIN